METEHTKKPKVLQRILRYVRENPDHLVLAFILLLFLFSSAYGILHIDGTIVPDQGAHANMIELYRSSWSFPSESVKTAKRGTFVTGNPFLYYWLTARLKSFVLFLAPNISDIHQRFFLVMSGVLCSLGNLIFVYKLACELIKNCWLRLLPVFMLANSIMFYGLGLSFTYDNMLNFLCILAIYELVCIYKEKDFSRHSLLLLIAACLGVLTKKTAMPLALILFVLWLVWIIWKKPSISLPQVFKKHTILLAFSACLALFTIGFYGRNLVKYHKVIPSCYDLFNADFCDQTGFTKRRITEGLAVKLTIPEAIKSGYPDPLRYFFSPWLKLMLTQTIGFFGHKLYDNPLLLYYQVFWVLIFVLAVIQIHRPTPAELATILITVGYALAILANNYNSQLIYGFKGYGVQGRYLFPIFGALYCLAVMQIERIKFDKMRPVLGGLTALLFALGGPVQLFYYRTTLLAGWFL